MDPIPIIDLFAGPGGLGEGFSSLKKNNLESFFELCLSIEKTEVAHRTLILRAVFRRLHGTQYIKYYYNYVRGEISESEFRAIPFIASAFEYAIKEAKCLELGKTDEVALDSEILNALNGRDTWVLIGGPPCQAYSLAGRSRRAKDKNFHNDEKHFLYKEYLRIIKVHKPTIFVMENVKGLLSSKHSGNPIFEKIIADLSKPTDNLEYEIRSFTKSGDNNTLVPNDYVIKSELFGIPQRRQRVILLGIKKGFFSEQHQLLKKISSPTTVKEAIGDLPKIRSKLSKKDSFESWYNTIIASPSFLVDSQINDETALIETMQKFVDTATITNTGKSFIEFDFEHSKKLTELQTWLRDQSLGGVCQHEARSHMASDLARYLFSATFAYMKGFSPTLKLFPKQLLPNHTNAHCDDKSKPIPFNDRFRVQCMNEPATTVVAHIAKDGHYYIHYDPSQCRSLTVREAARLQTFPDNYFFAGNRTEQYTQIGNAVPPLLAQKLAEIVKNIIYKVTP